jgi:hypothetical protein
MTRHTARALPDSAGNRIAVGQAFQPDSLDVGLESLTDLKTPFFSPVPCHQKKYPTLL